ncbi:prion-inhibition and propagation-domain-containing protein [Leptodontidium sp. MPI-SDFR-AT-0119]|nr:prion-inhibition and propagation-domain-containing protein [Leptodontidium sp. MPI-SDFR-AT-0119]
MEASLAVLGLTAQLFVSAVHSYRFISTAQHLRRDASIEFWKLRIQEVRLRSWGRHWGAGREEFDKFLEEENLVEDVRGILTQIQELFTDSKKLKEKYGLKIEGVSEPESLEQRILLGILRARNPDKPTLAQKFLWSLKDKQKFASLVSDLKELNDGLYCLFDASERRSIGACNESDILRLTYDPVDCDNIQQACIAYRDEAVRDGSSKRRWLSSPYVDLIKASGAKKLAIKQSEESVMGYIKQSPTGLRILAEYCSKVILIEWKTIDEKNSYQALITQRMENLARLLEPASPKPSDFRVLNCLGYFRDKALPRYGYLFEFPSNTVQQPPVTLHDLLSRGGPHELLLDLGDRFTLARTLASSLLRLHECGWVHTSFRSESILFFSEQADSSSSTPQPCINDPYISGFGYSKPNDPAESTLEYSLPNRLHDLYRHPEIVKSRGNPGAGDAIRLQQRHDLFSLGIVLLEIGLWEQINALWKEKYTPSAFLTKLLTAYVPRLGHKMGTVYRDVVSDLLNMQIEQYKSIAEVASFFELMRSEVPADEKKNKGKDLDELDWWNVVVRLEKCKA